MKTKSVLAIAATLWLSLSTLTLFAQNPPNNSASGPIDGGILLLVVGGAAMGYRKFKEVVEIPTQTSNRF